MWLVLGVLVVLLAGCFACLAEFAKNPLAQAYAHNATTKKLRRIAELKEQKESLRLKKLGD